MSEQSVALLVAVIGSVGGVLLGIAALRRSGAEADKESAAAASSLAAASTTVVTMLRDQVSDLGARVTSLEHSVGQWEGWAERVLDLLDRTLVVLNDEHRAAIEPEVQKAKADRPSHTHAGSRKKLS